MPVWLDRLKQNKTLYLTISCFFRIKQFNIWSVSSWRIWRHTCSGSSQTSITVLASSKTRGSWRRACRGSTLATYRRLKGWVPSCSSLPGLGAGFHSSGNNSSSSCRPSSLTYPVRKAGNKQTMCFVSKVEKSGVDQDVQKAFSRQLEHQERAVQSLKRRSAKSAEEHEEVYFRIMKVSNDTDGRRKGSNHGGWMFFLTVIVVPAGECFSHYWNQRTA